MKKLILILVMLATTGCDPLVRRSEAESIAENMADAQARTSSGRVEELESEVGSLQKRVEALESQLNVAERNTNTLYEKSGPIINDWQTEAIETLYENDRKFAARTGVPFEERRRN